MSHHRRVQACLGVVVTILMAVSTGRAQVWHPVGPAPITGAQRAVYGKIMSAD